MNAPQAGRKEARSCVSLCDIVILKPHDQARTASHCLSSASRRVRSVLGHGVGLYAAGAESRAPRRESASDRSAMDPRPGRRSLQRGARSRGHPLGHPRRDRGRTELEALAPRPGGPSRRFASAEETLRAWCQRQAVARPRPQSTWKRAVETAALGTTEELREWRRTTVASVVPRAWTTAHLAPTQAPPLSTVTTAPADWLRHGKDPDGGQKSLTGQMAQ